MDTVDMIGLGDLTPRDPLQLPTHCAPGLLVGRAYPLTAAAPVVPSPCTTVQIGAPQRTYTQAEVDALLAAERSRIDQLLRNHQGVSLETLEYLETMRDGPTPEEWAELDANARDQKA